LPGPINPPESVPDHAREWFKTAPPIQGGWKGVIPTNTAVMATDAKRCASKLKVDTARVKADLAELAGLEEVHSAQTFIICLCSAHTSLARGMESTPKTPATPANPANPSHVKPSTQAKYKA
jgi:hypothetical protein